MRQFDLEKIDKDSEPILRPEKKKSQRGSFLPYLLGGILGVIVVFMFTQLQGNLLSNKTEETKSSETETAGQNNSSSESETAVSTPTETVKEAAPTLDKSKITIRISNGNGVAGDGVKVKTLLEKDGFKVTSVGNASSFTYQTTIVYYKEGQEAAGKAVEDSLKAGGRTTSLEKSDSLTQYDVLVVVGKK